MDPHSTHSRLSQFNNRRTPKVGPVPPSSRHMDLPSSKPILPTESKPKSSSSGKSSASAGSFMLPRPIATNSRIKQNQQFHRDLHLTYVNNALQQKALGNSEAFDDLVSQFDLGKFTGDMPSPAPQLRLWISALAHVVSRLERTHSALVDAIVTMPWTTMDAHFVKTYISFIGMLVSARPEYLSLVLDKIVQGFTYQFGIQILGLGVPESSSSPLTRRTIYDRLHNLLRNLLSLIPTLPSILQSLLVRYFPHKRLTLAAHVTYIRNILRIAEYCPEIADRILSTIVDRAIHIDVEVQIELEELEEQIADQGNGEMFEIDPFDTIVGQEGETADINEDEQNEDGDDFSDLSSDAGQVEDDDDAPGEITPDFHHIQDMVSKLDTILKLIFDHFNHSHAIVDPATLINSSCSDTPPSTKGHPPTPSRSSSPASVEYGKLLRRSQFHALLSIFDRTIIRTFKSRYTQFLVFWYSSLDPEFSDLFQGMLIEKALLDQNQPTVTRVAAASYIASFVSRAQFVDRQSTRNVISVLCDFISSNLEGFDAVMRTGGEVSVTQCTMFYAIAQAVFLIFCFRWRDLLEEQAEDLDELSGGAAIGSSPTKKWMRKLNIVQRAISSELNPLKICSTNVVMQFARVAHATDFIYCYPILEANKRSEYVSNATNGTSPSPSSTIKHLNRTFVPTPTSTELNTFFPFDPFKLPKSSPYIEGVYRDWSSVAIADEDEDEDEDDQYNEEELVQRPGIALVGRRGSQDSFAGGLGASFEGMNISPAGPELIS